MTTRTYRQTRRAEQQAATRQRIVEAIAALHGEIGPARTTVSAVAERAGVERLTVYRHFADEAEMFQACSVHFTAEVPWPDPAAWTSQAEPVERLRAALLSFYGYYRRGEPMIANALRDAPGLPALAAVLTPFERFVHQVHEGLVRGWAARGSARARLAAAVGHALRFETWRSLVRAQGLGDAEAAELMVALAEAAGRAPRAGRSGARRPQA